MNHHFLKVCAATPMLRIGDCEYNVTQIEHCLEKATKEAAELIVFPELCITGYTCGDLFFQTTLLEQSEKAMERLIRCSKQYPMWIVVGAPVQHQGNLYNAALVIYDGKLLGMVPKTYLPNYNEFYEKRWFASGNTLVQDQIFYAGDTVPFATNLLFRANNNPYFTLGMDICEDVWAVIPPSLNHAIQGATVIANLSASNEIIGKSTYRKALIGQQSARTLCAYIYTSSGVYESTTDLVFGGHKLIYENGSLLAESELFEKDNALLYSIVDLEKLYKERLKMHMMQTIDKKVTSTYQSVTAALPSNEYAFTRMIGAYPFIPSGDKERKERCKQILAIQAHGLARRMQHTHCNQLVIGISGGLDSTLALLVCAKAMQLLEIDNTHIIGITMPGFGTTDRTYTNALSLMKHLGVTIYEIPIRDAVLQHFKDIGHDINNHDVTYENSQARERTQILMDMANRHNALVVGTGDLSELALGWATYNGDHMSMYSVNASIPKTLVRYLIDYIANYESKEEVKSILVDILETPVSPELLPPDKQGSIAQKTEDLVGPYALHDFYLYYMIRFGFSPSKIYYLAKHAFEGTYDEQTILKWIKIFYRRFFTQQFKRSCLPDGPKVGSICLSPRGDWRMPSDASSKLWLDEIETLK